MSLSSQTKVIIAVLALIMLIYFFYNRKEKQVHNDGALNIDPQVNYLENNNRIDTNSFDSPDDSEYADYFRGADNISSEPASIANTDTNADTDARQLSRQMIEPTREEINSDDKFIGKNRAIGGYKRSNYSDGVRGNVPGDWESYYDNNNNLVANSYHGDGDFMPNDETNGNYVSYVPNSNRETCGSNQNCEPEDLFDPEKVLPQQINPQWFEVMPEPISVKNRHLIPIAKPIGINTIGSSMKNASYDVRASPACPKMPISPFLNSSIEPDVNIKPWEF